MRKIQSTITPIFVFSLVASIGFILQPSLLLCIRKKATEKGAANATEKLQRSALAGKDFPSSGDPAQGVEPTISLKWNNVKKPRNDFESKAFMYCSPFIKRRRTESGGWIDILVRTALAIYSSTLNDDSGRYRA